MTLTEKLLARASGKAHVAPGDNVWVETDVLLTHDVCGPGTIGVFNGTGPAKPMTMRQMLAGVAAGVKAQPKLTWVPADFLEAHRVEHSLLIMAHGTRHCLSLRDVGIICVIKQIVMVP